MFDREVSSSCSEDNAETNAVVMSGCSEQYLWSMASFISLAVVPFNASWYVELSRWLVKFTKRAMPASLVKVQSVALRISIGSKLMQSTMGSPKLSL